MQKLSLILLNQVDLDYGLAFRDFENSILLVNDTYSEETVDIKCKIKKWDIFYKHLLSCFQDIEKTRNCVELPKNNKIVNIRNIVD